MAASIRAGVAYVDILPRFTKFNAALQKNLAATSRRMALVGSTVSRYVTLPILAAGAAAVKTAVSFEASMAKIEGLVGIARGEVEKMSKAVLELAPQVGKGPQELADALYFITSSGFQSAEALDVLKASAKSAAAGLGDTQVVADAITSAISAYGKENLSAAQAADVLVAGVREGKGEADDLASVIGRVIPIAAEMAVEFDQVTAAIAGMTLGGLSSAEAVTALRQFFVLMLKPAQQSRKVLEDIGLTADDVATITNRLNISMAKGGFTMNKLRETIAEKGLFAGMTALKTALGDNADAIGRGIPNVRALAGFLNLTGKNAKRNAEIFEELANSAGSMEAAFEVAQRTAQFKLNQALSQLKVTGVEVGNILIPVVTEIAAKFAQYAKEFTQLPQETQRLVIKILALTAAIGPLLLVFSGLLKIVQLVFGAFRGLILAIGNVIKFVRFLAGANGIPLLAQAFNVSTAAMASGLAVLTVAVGGAIVLWNKFREANQATANSMLNDVLPALLTTGQGLDKFVAHSTVGQGLFGESDIEKAAKAFDDFNAGLLNSSQLFYQLSNIAGVTNEQIAGVVQQQFDNAVATADATGQWDKLGVVIETAMRLGIHDAATFGTMLFNAGVQGSNLAAALAGVNEQAAAGIRLAIANHKAWSEGTFIGPVTADQAKQLAANKKAFAETNKALSTSVPKLDYQFGKGGLPGAGAGASKGASERSSIADRLREALADLSIPKFKELFKKPLAAALPAASEAMEGLRDRLRTLTEAATDANRKGLVSDKTIKKLQGLNRSAASLSARLSDLMDRMEDLNKSIESGFDKFADFSDLLEKATPGKIIQDFAKRSQSAKEFAALLQQAAARGLSADILQQVAAQGPEGVKFLKSVQSLSAQQIKDLNAQQALITKLRQQTIAALDKQYFGPAFATLSREINKFSKTLGNFVYALKKIVNKIAPSIKLAKGGLVTRPTIALIGEGGPEAVIPLNKLPAMSGGGDVINVYPQTLVSTKSELVRELRRLLLEKKRRNTRVGLA